MKAVLMAGGLGTRLRPMTYVIPKPLLPVEEAPILEKIIENLSSFGFNDIILATGYRSYLIELYFGDGSKFGVNITYSKEKKRLGTAGPLKLVENWVNGPFLVMNGDVLTKLNFKKLMVFHEKNKAVLTVGVKKHETKIPYGVIETEKNRIVNIKEKPVIDSDVAAGVYVLSPEALEYIPENTYYNIPDLILKLINDDKKVLKYDIKEELIDLGRIDSYKIFYENSKDGDLNQRKI